MAKVEAPKVTTKVIGIKQQKAYLRVTTSFKLYLFAEHPGPEASNESMLWIKHQ